MIELLIIEASISFIMKMQTSTLFKFLLGTGFVMTVGLVGCTSSNQATDSNPSQSSTPVRADVPNPVVPTYSGIKIDGSSTVYPVSEVAAKEYRKEKGDKAGAIDVKFSGTSSGFKKFCAGEIDINNASRPILKEEIEACGKTGVRFYELPIAFDALTLVVNPQNTWAKDITVAELKKIWEPAAQGKITNWNQVRASYPNQPLKLYGAGKESGTFNYFNEVTTGKPNESRTDYTASENDNELVAGVLKDPNALGYFGLSYYEAKQNELKALAVDYEGRGAVLPSRETVEKAQYRPFSRPLFIYVNITAAQRKPELQAFVTYYLDNAKRFVTQVGYIPLPDEGYRLTNLHFYQGKVGTVFDGVPQPDLTISELLRKQAVF
ncbi:periplasmic phosphate-binding protein of ABC transporter [Leptolyngbya boryana NIES-2135]|uniref:Phosphate-binding protein n=3 Tax=Leptolyngbya group TaxID=3081713 RepID=A0A1Z4JQN9_LEPBY|nr:periplasmic phosphate-binding protein of ABC transporter [Leptolyngbya boryana NIES-2135]